MFRKNDKYEFGIRVNAITNYYFPFKITFYTCRHNAKLGMSSIITFRLSKRDEGYHAVMMKRTVRHTCVVSNASTTILLLIGSVKIFALSRDWNAIFICRSFWRNVLSTLVLFVYVWWCPTHVVLCFCFVFLRLVASFSGLSFLISLSVFSSVYLQWNQ